MPPGGRVFPHLTIPDAKEKIVNTGAAAGAAVGAAGAAVLGVVQRSMILGAATSSTSCRGAPEWQDVEKERAENWELVQRMLTVDSQLAQRQFTFWYKNRACCGKAIHVVAMHTGPDGVPTCQRLLELRADVSEECTFLSWHGMSGSCQAVHIAAGEGNVSVLEKLIEARADVEAEAKFNEAYHFRPVHEACHLKRAEAVEVLLRHRADANEKNRDGLTGMHLAVKQGAVDVVQVLVNHGAGIKVRSQAGDTPLIMAIEFDNFPHRYLHLLARKDIEEVIAVGYHSRAAASDLMRDHQPNSDKAAIHESWRKGLKGTTLDQWIRLMCVAPEAAGDVLEALTVVPNVTDPAHHKLPNHARMGTGEMRCHYGPETEWKFNFLAPVDRERYPYWHDTIAPGRGRKAKQQPFGTLADNDDWVEVRVKLVALPGLIDTQTLHVLSATKHQRIFMRLAAQAVTEYAWTHVVKLFYLTRVIARLVLVAVLHYTVQAKPDETHTWIRSAVWLVCTAIPILELVHKAFEFKGYLQGMNSMFLWSLKNFIDTAMVVLSLVLAVVAMPHWGHHGDTYNIMAWPFLLAIVSFYRWVQLFYSARLFVPYFGERILPIIHTFYAMGPIATVGVFTFGGFYQMFLAIETISDEDERFDFFMMTYRLLFEGDTAILDELLGKIESDESVRISTNFVVCAGLLIFSLIVVNLSIAVFSEAYDVAQEHAKGIFYQEQATICLGCFLLPHWPSEHRLAHPIVLAVVLRVIAIGCAVGLLEKYLEPPAVVAVVLAPVMLSDAILLQRPWSRHMQSRLLSRKSAASASNRSCGPVETMSWAEEKVEPEPSGTMNHLWVCYRTDWDPMTDFPMDHLDMTQVKGRMSSLKADATKSAKQMLDALEQMKEKVLEAARQEAGARGKPLSYTLNGSQLLHSQPCSHGSPSSHRQGSVMDIAALEQRLRRLESTTQRLEGTTSSRFNGIEDGIERLLKEQQVVSASVTSSSWHGSRQSSRGAGLSPNATM